MIHMVFAIKGCDVRAAKSTAALIAEEAEASEVICFAEGILSLSVLVVCGEELGGDDVTTILSVQS